MSNLSAFLHPVQGDETKEIIISKRFVGEDGKPVPFKIRALSQAENEELTKRSTRKVKSGGQWTEHLDNLAYGRRVVTAATVEPDFASAELCKAHGTMDPLEVPGKMLLAGEYSLLSKEILRLSGFADDPEDVSNQAKN